MTTHDRFDEALESWLLSVAPDRGAEYLGEVSAAIERTAQRPAWANPRRWLGGVVAPWSPARLPRAAWVVALITLLVGAAIAAGALQSRPTTFPWSGPGANGLIAFEFEGRIVVASADGSGRRDLTPPPDSAPHGVTSDGLRCCDSSMAWSPDGRRLAFLRRPSPHPGDTQVSDLMVVNADGSGLRTVTTNLMPTASYGYGPIGAQALEAPTWSPDGRWLAIAAAAPTPAGGLSPRILLIDADSGAVRSPLPPSFWAASGPAWSPNGQTLAFAGEATDPNLDVVDTDGIYSVNVDGSGLVKLTTRAVSGDARYVHPSWSTDGRSVIATYESHPGYPGSGPASEIVRISLTGSGESAIGSTVNSAAVSISPDGGRIAYFVNPPQPAGDGSAGVGLAVEDLNTNVTRTLIVDGLEAGYPLAWSPDGQRLLVLPQIADPVHLWAVDAVGTAAPVDLTLGPRLSDWEREATFSWEWLAP